MEIRWILALGTEVAFWALFTSFLVLRYRYGLERASTWVLAAIVLDQLALVGLGVWDFAETGHVGTFTVVIAALLGYALTFGHRDMRRLDAWMARRISRRSPARRAAAPARSPR